MQIFLYSNYLRITATDKISQKGKTLKDNTWREPERQRESERETDRKTVREIQT